MAYSYLTDSTYGKDNVKFLKVKKDKSNPKKHEIMEATVKVLLKGDFDVSYTEADNSPIVPTDTVKNTILILARQYDTWPTEKFAAKLALHFTEKYGHVSGVTVQIYQDRWVKYDVDNKESLHSFIHQGPEKKVTFLNQRHHISSTTMQANHSVSYLYESSTSKRSNGLFSQTQKQESFQKALSQTQEEIEDEDLMVDLNTGSLTPVKLKYWTQMSAMTEKFGKL